MPRNNLTKTPTKLNSPKLAGKTRSARKRRNNETDDLGPREEKDVSTPQAKPDVVDHATPSGKATIRSEEGNDAGVPLPPLPSTPLPPLPPSGRKSRSARKKREHKADESEPSSAKVHGKSRKKSQASSPQKKIEDSDEVSKLTVKVTEPPSKKREITRVHSKMKKTKKSHEKKKIPEVKVNPKPKQMAVQVHRLRNLNYIPKGILRLCSTPFSQGGNQCPQLAISREGGSVELVSVNEKWKCVGIVEGMRNRNIDAMVWVCGSSKLDEESHPMITDEDETKFVKDIYFSREHQLAAELQANRKLFGASRDGTIFEIDFKTKRLSGVMGSGGGAVFCLSNLYGNLIAAGCEDGSVRIYKDASNTRKDKSKACLELVSTLPSVGGAIISITWLPGSGVGRMAGSVIYAGASDGTIRKFECVSALQMGRLSGHAPHAISTGAVLNSETADLSDEDGNLSSLRWKAGLRITVENHGRRSATKIWALKVLRDGTIVSGDSMGNVQFWDGNAGTLLQSFEHNQNNGDVLDLAISFNENKVMASGVDSKVVCIERISSSSCSESKWVLTNQQRSHTHDVSSLCMIYLTDPVGNLGSSEKIRELLCTGGVDTKVCSYFVANMRKYRAKTAYKYPTRAPIAISKGPRIISIMRPDKVDFYQLVTAKMPNDSTVGSIPQDEERASLGSVSISSNYNLVSMDVSDDGNFLAVSHTAGLLLFSLKIIDTIDDQTGAKTKVIVPRQLTLPSDTNVPCSALKFGSNYLICGATHGPINIIRLQGESNTPIISLEHSFDHTSTENYAHESFPIAQITISADDRWFGVSKNAMGKGSVQVFSLTKKKHWWTLPCMEAPQSCMKFFGGGGDVDPAFAVSCNNGVVYLFDVENRRLSDWSQDLGFPAGPNLPRELSATSDCPESLCYNQATPNKFVMGGHSWFCSIDLSAPVPLRSKPYPSDHFKARNWKKAYLQERRRSKASNSNIEEEMRRDDESNKNFTICLRYSGVIFQDFLDNNEMVVVEQPWLSIVNTLPDALEHHRYGS